MRFFYTLGVVSYKMLLWLISPFHSKAKKWIVGRRNAWSKIESINWKSERIYWFHCASLGEFEQGRPLLERLKKTYPESQILVTFFSPSGYEIRKNYELADCICYLPIDTNGNAKRLYETVPINEAFFVKYEFWGNYILTAQNYPTKIYSLATILRPDQHFFKPWGGFFRKILNGIEHFFVQNEATAKLLQSIQIDKTTVIGDPRFDRVFENSKKVEANPILESFKRERIFAIGSSWSEDEALLLPIINQKEFNDQVIIAPHEVNESHISEIMKGLSKPAQRYTQIQSGEPLNPETQVLVIDCIGILADSYSYGDYAYVGGAFGSGLHNILEPCVFGLPVIFGPKHSKFPEGKLFIQNGIGFSIENQKELFEAIQNITNNLLELNQKCKELVEENVGASDLVFGELE